MSRLVIFLVAILVAIIAIALAVYYLIPMDTHILATGGGSHYRHALAFGAVAVVCLLGAAIFRPRSAE